MLYLILGLDCMLYRDIPNSNRKCLVTFITAESVSLSDTFSSQFKVSLVSIDVAESFIEQMLLESPGCL